MPIGQNADGEIVGGTGEKPSPLPRDMGECQHEADFENMALFDVIGKPGHWVLNVDCKKCGRIGAIQIDPAKIVWMCLDGS